MLVLISGSISGQDPSPVNEIIEENAVREEIQRYFGYEDLLYRYLTLPYDINANVNQQGKFVEIGFAFFSLIPVLLLYFMYDKKKWFYSIMIALVIYLAICLRFSFLLDMTYHHYNPMIDGRSVSTEMERWDGPILSPVYRILGTIGNPVKEILDNFTGQKDHITYPIICSIFFAFFLFLLRSQRLSGQLKIFAIILSTFAFLWWILSGGIIWYGLLMIPLFYILIFHGLHWAEGSKNVMAFRISRVLTLFIVTSWVFLSYTSRISNVAPNLTVDHPDYGKHIVDARIHPYTTGYLNEQESLNILAKNLPIAIRRMNEDSSLILKFGSSLAFDIKRNNERILEDNSLSYFYSLVVEHRTQAKVTQVMKQRGIKYLILDLQLRTLDRTPEKTLTRKYDILTMLFLKGNQQIRLVATDREVRRNGQRVMGVFSDKAPVVLGSYAVFEIL